MLELFDIPERALPQIVPSASVSGHTSSVGRLPSGLPIASLIGDSHAAMFCHGAFRPSVVKATYGTGSSLMMPVPNLSEPCSALSSTVAWAQAGSVRYALEGNITVTGGAMEWIGRFLDLAHPVKGAASLAASADSGGVYVVPAFAGLGAPWWDDSARGLITGLTRGTTAANVARASLEAIAYQIRDVFDAMERASGLRPPSLRADGGASQNDTLMQFQADILGCPVVRNSSEDLSAIGAAWLAGLTVGLWRDVAHLEMLPRSEECFEPRMAAAERARLYEGWHDAIGRALSSGCPVVKDNSRVHGSH
jgi:glycerol kinase